MKPKHMHPFESALLVPKDELAIRLGPEAPIPWLDFWLNPRKVRGSDFLMRWSQGRWSETQLENAVNATEEFFALPYGPSGVAPDSNVRAFELYFEKLEHAGLGQIKRPDLLIVAKKNKAKADALVNELGGLEELPFTPESDPRMKALVALATIAVECENSLWLAKKMPAYNTPLRPQKRLGGKLGLAKSAVLPTVIIKEEDMAPLRAWQQENGIPIHVWHVFYDLAYGVAFDEAERLIREGFVEPTIQVFQAPGGATTKKIIYKVIYHHAYPLAESRQEPSLKADCITDKNGHILPYVRFEGGRFDLFPTVQEVLNKVKK